MSPERNPESLQAIEVQGDGTTSEAQLILGIIYKHADPKKQAEVRSSILRELERDSVRQLRDRSVKNIVK